MKTTDHEKETEGLPSASEFDANFRCLGKRALEKQIPKDETASIDAARGDKIHKALQASDLSGLSPSDETTASRCLYAESEIVNQHGFEKSEAAFEERAWDLDDDTREPLWSAKIDTKRTHDDKGWIRSLILDYKTGWGTPVPIASNWQIRAEAVLAWLNDGASEVIAALIHPHHPDSLYETHKFDEQTLADLHVQIRGLSAIIQTPDQPRTPNGISCQFCRAKTKCPEYKAWIAQMQSDIIDEAETHGFGAIIARTPEERGIHYAQLSQVADYIKELRDRYHEFAEKEGKDTVSVTGFELRYKWDTKVTDRDEAIKIIARECGETAAHHCLKFDLVGFTEWFGKKINSKTEATKKVRSMLATVIEYKKSKPFLKAKKTP